ncbi:hypothetical protein [Streptomyces radicis]|uniref:DUF2304 domain-containing protein n=1 Tax=Streptomyces radicis TaxID=1750517 RepID=A0A3A9W835_9ACTN|nr:hypothetical protein [Streptomyces radicis]RKN09401.1 hypothetical protein D7319_13170 [Streptomyces radicis]RKN23001.1 hypothetical protein D7318_13355 [Streptomyces radicis]
MLLSVSAVLLLGLLIWFLVRIRYLRSLEAVLCTTFGFLLGQTAAAPLIQAVLNEVSALLAQIQL